MYPPASLSVLSQEGNEEGHKKCVGERVDVWTLASDGVLSKEPTAAGIIRNVLLSV